jgi:hypothetical protein
MALGASKRWRVETIESGILSRLWPLRRLARKDTNECIASDIRCSERDAFFQTWSALLRICASRPANLPLASEHQQGSTLWP